MVKHKFLSIFQNYFNKNNSKLTINTLKKNEVGKSKYFPSFSKEWNNIIYTYNINNTKHLPLFNINLNSIIKYYFDMYINLFNQKKPSINKIYVSKPELKFTNNKVVITIHTYNREKLVLLAKIKQLRTIFLKKLVEFILRNNKIFNSINSNTTKKVLKTFLHKEIMILEKYKVRTLTNQYKYKEIFLYKLGTLINTLYKKKVLFNIINLKSLTFNTDILTEMVDLRINKLDSSITYILKYLLNKVKLPKVNRTLEKLGIIKSVNNSLIQNKHKDLYLNSILNQNNFDEKLNELYLNLNKNQKNNIVDIIFNDIKYKNIGGIRLEIKGRITRRFKAEKTRSKVKWKGGLQNIDSSYKGLSSLYTRGYLKSNVQHSLLQSKRPIGAFATKGWISGK